MKLYEDQVDKRFDVFVERKAPYRGILTVKDDGVILLSEEVSLSYNAQFGADAADIAEWQSKALEVVDKYIANGYKL